MRCECSPNAASVRLQCLLLAAAALAAARCDRPIASSVDTVDQPGGIALLPGTFASRPLPAGEATGRFHRVPPAESGVAFAAPIDGKHPLRFLYHSGFMAGGVCLGDLDGDGRLDLFCAGGPVSNKVYLQTSAWKFADATAEAGVNVGSEDPWSAGAALVDIDADGDLDIYVCNYERPNQLFVNDGHARFTEAAARFGLDLTDACLLPTFCDYDRDGDLDVFVLTNRSYYPTGYPSEQVAAQSPSAVYVKDRYKRYFGIVDAGGRKALRPVGRPDYLLRNDGGRFVDASESSGIAGLGFGLSATWWDYDGDGWTDLYVANDMNDPDKLYRNNGDGTFADVIADVLPHTSQFSMGADFGDLDNDGRFDFLVADMMATNHFMQKTTMGAMGAGRPELEAHPSRQMMRNALYVNTGTGRFAEGAFLANLAKTDWTWAIRFGDLDNDGRLDVYATNGMTRSFNDSDRIAPASELLRKTEWDAYANTPSRREQNLAYRNRGELAFDDVSKAWGLDHIGISGAAASGDIDGDGDLDLVTVNLDEPLSLYRNEVATGHRVAVSLRGGEANRFGVGATVRIKTATGQQVRQLIPNTGFLGGSEPALHFGLGDDEKIDELSVEWPSGRRQTLAQLAADCHYTIAEPDSPVDEPAKGTAPRGETLFVPSDALAGAVHEERPFDDFKRQPLLPNQHSQLGPGMAWGDVDGDGDDDMFLGGAAGQAGQLFVNNGQGSFVRAAAAPWAADAASEDAGAVFFDADSDGDLDLYVASGGVECEPGDEVLRDRLYLNDGQGNFKKDAAALPDVRASAGPVAAGDFDRDGDLDLFVGGRIVPGRYPMAPQSVLLRNEMQGGGKFIDVAVEAANGLAASGMVTSAVWSDADGDGWLDLLVAYEWGPLRLWHNERGRLVDRTREAGLAERTGWHNGLAAADLDNDGDMDYVVTNFGLNTKYHASPDKPALLFAGDFDGSGGLQLVEAEFERETLFPVRGRSCSSQAMPFLRDKFKSYKEFALASLEDIYTDKCLGEALRLEITSLESGVWINEGGKTLRFRFEPLPRLAQISPGFGVVATEIDGDGRTDLYVVQNFFTPQWETGRMDSGVSQMLLGNGDGTFRAVSAAESGLVVSGDAKSLAATDLNGDGRVDFVVGVNDAPVTAWQQRPATGPRRTFAVRLAGKPGNPAAAGARVTVTHADGRRQTAEVHAGGGYLSQSSPTLYFAAPSDGTTPIESVEVAWPNGERTTQKEVPIPPAGTIAIGQP